MKKESFTSFMKQVAVDLQQSGNLGTAHVYRSSLNAILTFQGSGCLSFPEITPEWLKHFEGSLRARGCSWNTVSTYLRTLRAVYNRAVDAGLIAGEYRLFSVVFTGVKSEQKRALKAEEMHCLLDAKELPGNIRQSRDLLSLMLHLQGMPFTDLIHLHRDDLRTDLSGHTLLTCRRQKTGSELQVSVTDEAMKLINLYRSTDPTSPYLLCFLDGKLGGEVVYREYCRQLRILNYGLLKLASYSGLKVLKVSSYTARHTWATLAKYCQIPEEMISEGLGHSSLEVTRTYLKSFEGGEMAKANQMIIDYIYSGKKTMWSRA